MPLLRLLSYSCYDSCVLLSTFRNELFDHDITTMLTVFMLPALMNRWTKNMHHYDLGINESTFEYLATFYTTVLNALDIGLGLVFCECSEDESACQDDPRWNERRDELVGF